MTLARNDYRRIYAIGDIHGRSDLLDRMVGEIERDLDGVGGSAEHALTVTLGDYLDRGPDSRGVLERLVRNPFPTRYIALKGNHQELFESFLREPAAGRHWQQLGGLATLRSYDPAAAARLESSSGAAADFAAAAAALCAAVPSEHRRFLASLRPALDLGGYFLCHAGIRPGIAFEQQNQQDLLWIREEFLVSDLDFGKIVVHGHTPVQHPEVRPNRINIDTAAFATGRLTCVVLEGASHRFLAT